MLLLWLLLLSSSSLLFFLVDSFCLYISARAREREERREEREVRHGIDGMGWDGMVGGRV